MPFYIRKAISVGPLRFNISKSGIGVSVGIPGFRIGSGAQGNYVHAGRHGLYYRKGLPGEPIKSATAFKAFTETVQASLQPRPTPPSPLKDEAASIREFESQTALAMVDASSEEVLGELNSKRNRSDSWPWMLGGTVLAAIAVFAYGLSGWLVLLLAVIGAALTFWIYERDQLARHVVLMYELESELESSYRDLCDTFGELCKSGATWHIQSEKSTSGSKQNSSATSALDRRRVSPSIGGGPDHFKTNISVPKLPVGLQTLFLLPDRILVEAPEGYGAVKYSELVVTVDEERFIESGEPPSGARVVGTTWRYVNKSGEPDRRFKDNRELPIAIYERVHLRSPSGLNELIQLAQPGLGARFRTALLNLG